MDILQEILSAVASRLDELFPDVHVFVEYVPNNIPPECFLLDYAGNVEIKHSMGGRYEVKGRIDVTFLVAKTEQKPKAEFSRIFSILSLKMRHCVHEELKVRLYGHQRQVVDDVLHTLCDFSLFLYEINMTPVMRSAIARLAGVKSEESL